MPSDLDRPFNSALTLLGRSARLFLTRLPFIAATTLAVFVPGKLLMQFIGLLLDIPPEGVASYLLMDFSDLVLGAFAIPAVIHGLVSERPVGECLRFGRASWGRMLWNKFKVDITVSLYTLLLFVPGLIAMTRLALTDVIVALEGEREPQPLARSRELTEGRRWRVFLVVAPLGILELAGSFYLLAALPDAAHSRWILAAVDSLWAVVGMWSAAAGTLMYLGIVPRTAKTATGTATARRQRTGRTV